MARKRMFDMEIIDTDLFLEMPIGAQNLYFHLGMRADDDGFVSNPRKIQKLIGSNEDDLKILIAKQFIIPFETGIIVIRHWKLNNYLRKDRYTPTIYTQEKALLQEDSNGVYNLGIPSGIPNDNQMTTNGIHSIEENSIEKNSIEEKRKEKKESKKESFDKLIDNYTCNEELKYELKNHLAVRKAKKGAMTNRAIELSLKKLDELTYSVPVNEMEEEKIKIVQQSIERGWISFFELQKNNNNKKKNDGWDYINNEFERIKNDLF